MRLKLSPFGESVKKGLAKQTLEGLKKKFRSYKDLDKFFYEIGTANRCLFVIERGGKMKVKYTKEEKIKEIEWLKKNLKSAGYKVYSILRRVSQSGMNRKIDFFIFVPNSKAEIKKGYGVITKLRITYKICGLLDYPYDNKTESLSANGCGMDMGFSVVHNLSMALFCNGKYEHEKAYTLQNEWL